MKEAKSVGKKVAARNQFIDAALVSNQIFTERNFPALKIALEKWKDGDEPAAKTLFEKACQDANIPTSMVAFLWETLKKTNDSIIGDALAWLPGIGP